MKLTPQQLEMLRKPFEERGALIGYSEEEITKLLENIADLYITLAQINLRSKREST